LNKGLTSVVVNSFLVVGTSGYYLGTDDGLYFTGTMTSSTSWSKVISNVKVNALSYFGNSVFAGTNIGLYKGTSTKFEKFLSLEVVLSFQILFQIVDGLE